MLEARLEVDWMLLTLAELLTESAARCRLEQLNERIRETHDSVVPGASAQGLPADSDPAVEK